jgi:hypothetical protein
MKTNQFLHTADEELRSIDDDDLKSAASAIVASNSRRRGGQQLKALVDKRL